MPARFEWSSEMSSLDQRRTEMADLSDLPKKPTNGYRAVVAVAAICILAIAASIVIQGASPEAMRVAQSASFFGG